LAQLQLASNQESVSAPRQPVSKRPNHTKTLRRPTTTLLEDREAVLAHATSRVVWQATWYHRIGQSLPDCLICSRSLGNNNGELIDDPPHDLTSWLVSWMARDGVEDAITRAENGLESGWLGHCLLALSFHDFLPASYWKTCHSSHQSFTITTTTSNNLRLLLLSLPTPAQTKPPKR
jgi:hypothetical protein